MRRQKQRKRSLLNWQVAETPCEPTYTSVHMCADGLMETTDGPVCPRPPHSCTRWTAASNMSYRSHTSAQRALCCGWFQRWIDPALATLASDLE